MSDLRRIPLPPIPQGAITGDTLTTLLQTWQREVLAYIDVRWAELDLGSNIGIEGRAGSELPSIVSKIANTGRAQDQRFLPQVSAGNVLSVQSVAPVTATADASVATITIAAHTVRYGYGTVSYNAGTITGLTPETEYFVYADDPNYAGGAVAYTATTNKQTVVANDGRYFVGAVQTARAISVATITGATSANPVEFTTSANHGWNTGDVVLFAGLPGASFGSGFNGVSLPITRTAANKFTVAADTTGFPAYTSGGTATRGTTTEIGGGGAGGGWLDGVFP